MVHIRCKPSQVNNIYVKTERCNFMQILFTWHKTGHVFFNIYIYTFAVEYISVLLFILFNKYTEYDENKTSGV